MERVQTKMRRGESGFTLVELAIVMIIIGLLITGVLKGQEMINNAQVTSTVSQLKGIEAAMSTFRDTYNAFPGDLANAESRLANCTDAPCNTDIATSGNGRIDSDPGVDATAAVVEGTLAFNHLSAADLINGVASIAADDTDVNLGDELLEAEISRAGFVIGFAPTAADATGITGTTPWTSGHYVRLGNVLAAAGASANDEGLTANQAARMDIKLDDGTPNGGTVRAGGTAAGEAGCTDAADGTGIYNSAIGTQECQIFVRIQ